jgi:hypothetical protein
MSNAKYILNLIQSNDGLTRDHFDAEGWGTIQKMAEQGKVEILPGDRVKALPTKSTDQFSTKTTKAPLVSKDTLVSVRIGSDKYAGKVLKVTDSTVTVAYGSGSHEMTFRPSKGSWRFSDDYRLVLGESETVLDPHL